MVQRVYLANDLQVFALNAPNAALVHDEIFHDQVYDKHGITVQDGDCIFDVGANIGLYLVFLNRRLRRGRVVCFEPIPEIFDVLSQNAQTHNRLELELCNHGLAKASGTACFAFFPRSPADSSMFPDDSASARDQHRSFILRVLEGKTQIPLIWPVRLLLAITPAVLKRRLAELARRYYMKSRQVNCPVRTLSEVIDERHVERIDLLKMDVEGAEFDILSALRPEHWLRIRQIVIEVHGGAIAATAMRLLLDENGYRIYQEDDPCRPNNFMIYASRPCP